MRIIAGKFRGKRLKGPRGTVLRPTSDRLKETLFGILSSSICDTVFVDAFAGTGSIGLEALSRGAREVLFIESNPQALRLIQENLRLCGIAGGYRVLHQDVFTALRQLSREGLCADTLFLDPPYDWQPYRDLLEICFRTGLVHEGSRIVVEHHAKAYLPVSGEEYERARVVRQGDKCLSFYAYKRG
jgi:16S rRNA (guanine(966)-N(2))-methyltransferase RsmD